MENVKDTITLEEPPRTWPDVISSFEVGESRNFPSVNPASIASSRIAIARWVNAHPEMNFTTKSFSGYFTITRNPDTERD